MLCTSEAAQWVESLALPPAGSDIYSACEEFVPILILGLRCKTGSIWTRTTHVRWSEAGIPGTENRTKLVSSSAAANRKHHEKCHLLLITVTVCATFFLFQGPMNDTTYSEWLQFGCKLFGRASQKNVQTLPDDSLPEPLLLHMIIYSV